MNCAECGKALVVGDWAGVAGRDYCFPCSVGALNNFMDSMVPVRPGGKEVAPPELVLTARQKPKFAVGTGRPIHTEFDYPESAEYPKKAKTPDDTANLFEEVTG